jgi:hypothetical protein
VDSNFWVDVLTKEEEEQLGDDDDHTCTGAKWRRRRKGRCSVKKP